MKKILIIEDERTVLENISELLSSEDKYTVFEAVDGKSGIEFAKKHLPDLIICDIMMPDLNGYEVLSNLREEIDTSTIPFIFLTARSEKSDQRFGMELGADDYITKPFTSDEIFKAVDTRLKKREELNIRSEEKLSELRMNIASSLPHELRTPLNGIIASSQLLIEYFDRMDKDEIRQIHESINISAQRLNRLILNYLFFAELELLLKDKKRLEAYQHVTWLTNPGYTINDVFEATAMNYKRIKDLRIDAENIPLKIFDDHLHKICEELADNAFKFSTDKTEVKVTAKKVKDNYEIVVQDHGRGMSPEQIQKIGAYIQFDRNMYEQQGSGLGLIIVKRLLQIYDGNLFMNSNLNQFTQIKIQLPCNGSEQTN